MTLPPSVVSVLTGGAVGGGGDGGKEEKGTENRFPLVPGPEPNVLHVPFHLTGNFWKEGTIHTF